MARIITTFTLPVFSIGRPNVQIINNFIKPRLQDELEAMFLSNNFPYFYVNEMSTPYEYNEVDKSTGNIMLDGSTIEAPQFFHMFVTDGNINSQAYSDIAPVLNKVVDSIDEDYFVYRCKVNMNVIDTRFDGKYHTPHIDNGFDDQITAIYYVNDADGDTFFFDDNGSVTKRITPKKGTLVMWKGKVFHAKASPVKSLSRVVININLLPCKN